MKVKAASRKRSPEVVAVASNDAEVGRLFRSLQRAYETKDACRWARAKTDAKQHHIWTTERALQFFTVVK